MNDKEHVTGDSASGPVPEGDQAALESGAIKDGRDRPQEPAHEIGGRKGPDPVRYGDWEKNGRCIDF